MEGVLPVSKDGGGQSGITDPPPEIKENVDKTAKFMASVHPRMEQSIIKDIGRKPNFSFLNAEDAHNAYYQHRVSEFRALSGSADGNEGTGYYWFEEKFGTGKKITTGEWEADFMEKYERDLETVLGASPTVVSPITREPIPVFTMFQHLRDPNYKEQRERLFAKIRETSTLAEDERIITTIVLFTGTRPGVFETDEDEFCKQVRQQIEGFCLRPATEIVSPFTGQPIPVDEISQHMQDPRYKEEKENWFAKVRDATLAQDDQIYTIIDWLARSRPDLLGTTIDEFFNAIISKIESTDQELEQLHKSLFLELSYDSTPPVTPPAGSPTPPPPEEAKLDVSLLVPEAEFLARNPGPARIRVSVSVAVKVKMLDISVESLAESVSSFKEKIAQEIDVPTNMQKLELSGMSGPFEDNLSLAYYNVAGGDLLSLSW